MEASDALLVAERLRGKLVARRPFVVKTDDYCEGKQPLAFASREWSEFHKDRYAGFSDNWCAPVADAVSERIAVTGVKDKEFEGLWDAWQRNDGDAQSSQGFHASAVNSVSYALVWGDESDQPLMTWEHASEVFVERDPATRRVRFGVKCFVDDDVEFLTLYTPEAVWKWKRETSTVNERPSGVLVSRTGLPAGSGWDANQALADDTWPIRNPFGRVPIAEFPNRPRLTRGPLSDIQGAMAMQDAINLLWAYLFGAADHASLPARVVMGQEPPKLPILDENGQKIGDKVVDIKDLQKGRMLWLTGQDTKIAQWDAAKLDVFTDVIEIAVGHIAAQTRTPPHYLNTKAGISNLSGDALVAAETGLVQKALAQIRSYRAGMRDLFQLLALAKGEDRLADQVTSDVFEFKNPGMRSEAQLTDALLKKSQMGYPFEYLMELDGVIPEDRVRVLAMVEKEISGAYLGDGVLNVRTDSAEGH